MTRLGRFLVQDEATFNESRRKMLRLAVSLGFDEIAATRLAVVYSELCRLGLRLGDGAEVDLGLEQLRSGLALALRFTYALKPRPPLFAGEFLRSFAPVPGSDRSYQGLLPLPDHGFHPSPEQLESLRNRLAHPSREELLRDLAGKNTALEQEITERMRMEEAVRESELKYRELVENANSIILKLDSQGRITFFNEFAQKFFGFSQEEILGRSIVGTIVPETESTGRDLSAFIRDLVANPDKYARNENQNITRNGELVWVGWTNQAVMDEATGEPVGVLCVGSDVTAQKIAQMQRDDALELISGSIRYASRIQQSVLPAPEALTALFAEHFVLWEPRDVVGGDIYWSAPWGRGSLFVLGDCTGHGVPGAFMTLIATGALSKALGEVQPGDVAALVARTHRLVQTGLNQNSEGGGSDDGMELGVCHVPDSRDSLRFCGARFSLFLLENGEISEHKGDRRGIGYRGIPLDFPYTAQDIALRPGQRFFLTTDGLLDQIGWERKRSYGKKRFTELLLELAGMPLAAHPEAIQAGLRAFQGGEKRRDDVSVAGFSVL